VPHCSLYLCGLPEAFHGLGHCPGQALPYSPAADIQSLTRQLDASVHVAEIEHLWKNMSKFCTCMTAILGIIRPFFLLLSIASGLLFGARYSIGKELKDCFENQVVCITGTNTMVRTLPQHANVPSTLHWRCAKLVRTLWASFRLVACFPIV
jgi:hypothetical protein